MDDAAPAENLRRRSVDPCLARIMLAFRTGSTLENCNAMGLGHGNCRKESILFTPGPADLASAAEADNCRQQCLSHVLSPVTDLCIARASHLPGTGQVNGFMRNPQRPEAANESMLLKVMLIVVIGYVGWNVIFPAYVHRCRLTITVELNGEIRSGSSVIEVTWQKQRGPLDAPPYSAIVRGHSPLVDLGLRGMLLAALDPSADTPDNESVSAAFVALRGFGFFADRPRSFPPTDEGLRALSHFHGRAELGPGRLSQLIWIPNVNDAGSAVHVLPEDLGRAIDAGVRFRLAIIENAAQRH